MLDIVGRPQSLVTDCVPFAPTPLNKDDDARTAQIAAEAGSSVVRSAPPEPPRPGHVSSGDFSCTGELARDDHEGRAAVLSAGAHSV